MADIRVKICGLRTVGDVEAAAAAGAAYAGFVFFPKSPRSVTITEAQPLALAAPVEFDPAAIDLVEFVLSQCGRRKNSDSQH